MDFKIYSSLIYNRQNLETLMPVSRHSNFDIVISLNGTQ